MTTYKILAFGKVQGVGYRNFTQKVAQDCNFKGSVKNKDDGSVEIFINLKKENLGDFLSQLQEGNGRMQTQYFNISFVPTMTFNDFSILR